MTGRVSLLRFQNKVSTGTDADTIAGITLVDVSPKSDPISMALRNATEFDAPCQELYAQFSSPPK